MQFQFFDPEGEVLISARKLPHWDQAGTTCFITFRTDDSLPESVIAKLKTERADWLRVHGIDVFKSNWKSRLSKLSKLDQRVYHETFTSRWMDLLDEGHGACVLRQPPLAKIVADALHFFDGDRYILGDFVVMPNHVHLLVQFPGIAQLKKQCKSWKRFTAIDIHKELGGQGHFWQAESFDHLVRSAEQFAFLRKYIADNPIKAKLKPGEYIHYVRPA
jgi:putative transposase